MRGGGKIYHKDPLFLESSFSFLKFLRFAVKVEDKGSDAEPTSKIIMEPEQNATIEVYFDDHNVTGNRKNYQTVSKSTSNSVMSILHSATKVMGIDVPGPEYLNICRKEPHGTTIAIGFQENPLSGLRFCLLGRLGTWKKHNLTHDMVKQLIINMGGTVLENEQADVLMSTHSQLPNCFVLANDEKDLILGTGSKEEISDMKKPRKRGTSATREGRNETSQYSKIAKRFAAGGFKFLNIDFVAEVDEKKMLIDPEPYILQPGFKLVENRVNDKRPLFLDQCSEKTLGEGVSAFVALKIYRDGTFKQLSF